ncbi:MAG: DUF3284 domain-containing protein [Sarcina sp.]
MAANTFKNSAVVDYSNIEIFKVIKKMIRQDFPRFNEKNPIGTSVTKQIGSYSTKTAEAYVEITDYKENELYEITTVTSKGRITYVSKYILTPLEDGKTEFTLEQTQGGPGIFTTLNHMLQSFLYKGRIKKRFDYLLQGLDAEIKAMRERSTPKKKSVENDIAASSIDTSNDDSDLLDIKEKENISE